MNMFLKKVEGPRAVKLPNGNVICLADLPDNETSRWVASRKAVVIQAVKYGLVDKSYALKNYNLSDEEFAAWCLGFEKFGYKGLKTTKLRERYTT